MGRTDYEAKPDEAVVGVVCDPGSPAELMESLADRLPDVLTDRVDAPVRWRLDVRREELELDDSGTIPIAAESRKWLQAEGWDFVLFLTDLPRMKRKRPMLAKVNLKQRAGLVSLPAIGWFRLQRPVRDTIVHLLGILTSGMPDGSTGRHRIRRRPTEVVSPVRQLPLDDQDADLYLVLSGARGWLRLLFGMVRDNRPWRLVPGLSKALAAALAAAAFGIFFSTIWTLADALSATRLSLISAAAVTAMVVWLITQHRLWHRPRRSIDRGDTVLFNTASVLTLFLGVTCMYVVLFAALLFAALIIISGDYFQSQLGHPVGFTDYLSIVWLSSSLGTFAGAIGSTLETQDDLHRAAYSRRERQRRERWAEEERTENDDQNPRSEAA
ncbi:hypothetical protein [Haloechinothrix salitolerans]|uniref:DUF2267 domain-containing protein n=1 Tax=Haloechinothrix salitolerans TaxID=926830 RepID=A0ABW2C126_9PSEU